MSASSANTALYQAIHAFLLIEGLTKAASALKKEAKLGKDGEKSQGEELLKKWKAVTETEVQEESGESFFLYCMDFPDALAMLCCVTGD